MPTRALLAQTLAAAVLVIASLACGQSNAAVQVGTQAPAPPAGPPPQPTIHRVGEILQFSDHTISLQSAEYVDGDLQTIFNLHNTGVKDMNVSALIQFDARLPDGTQLEDDIFDCPAGHFDGRVLPGERLKGSICWTGVTGDTVRIYYTPNIFGTGAAVWEVTR